MGDLHNLVILHGREKARELVPPHQRALVDIAAEVLADEERKIGISYTGFCLTSLPHKRLENNLTWEKKGHQVTLWVEPGRLMVKGEAVHYGVPYGARARMILFYLQSRAVRTGQREVELGRSMREWMERMGLSVGGETAKGLKEQASRISACTLKFFWENESSEAWSRGGIVSSGLRFKARKDDARQGSLWDDTVTLDEVFWKELQEHPVPIQETAIQQLRDRSMSLDIYVWLAWRLHSLRKPTPITWFALFNQFGGGFKQLKHWKPVFTEATAWAVAAYPGARVDLIETGLVLHPAKPPVTQREQAFRSVG